MVTDGIIPPEQWFSHEIKLPLIIGGPCSAESPKQLLATAEALKAGQKIHVFRAGIWKPRTRPGSFMGVGEKAIPWLIEVRERTGLPVITEVAMPAHLEKCLNAGIDMVWIGARTVSNPFSVQELAEAMKGISIPVLIKNPINPDLSLWIGAIERVMAAGVRRIAAIHRGFFPFEKTTFRNIPKWEIPIELKSRYPDLPILCDPSHIAGTRSLVADVAQKALDLNLDGLMVEVHNKPAEALSDKKQQFSPREFATVMNRLVFRRTDFGGKRFLSGLASLRDQVDSVDDQIIGLLAERMALVKRIGYFKKENNIGILQVRRWNKIVSTLSSQASKAGLGKEFIQKFLQLIHEESIRKQTRIYKSNGKKGSRG